MCQSGFSTSNGFGGGALLSVRPAAALSGFARVREEGRMLLANLGRDRDEVLCDGWQGVTTAVSSFGVSPVCHAFGSPVRSRTILTVASSSSYVDIG